MAYILKEINLAWMAAWKALRRVVSRCARDIILAVQLSIEDAKKPQQLLVFGILYFVDSATKGSRRGN